jgi:hypothetical protein
MLNLCERRLKSAAGGGPIVWHVDCNINRDRAGGIGVARACPLARAWVDARPSGKNAPPRGRGE